MKNNILRVLGVAAMLSLSACNGMFDEIYDMPSFEAEIEYGFIHIDHNDNSGRIYIDATDYEMWHYVNLEKKEVVSLPVGAEAPSEWHFAIHRYDAKTNGGAVLESNAAGFSDLPDMNAVDDACFVADEWTESKIITDMSQMMDGIIGYAPDYYNACLSRWLDVDKSVMPPIYTLSGKVYLLRMADGTCAALRLSDFMNDAAIKGYMTIDYQFPVP